MVLKPQRFSINPRVGTRIPKTNETREGGGKRPSPLSLQPKPSPGELCLFKVNSTSRSQERHLHSFFLLPPLRGTPHILASAWSALTHKSVSCSIRQLCGETLCSWTQVWLIRTRSTSVPGLWPRLKRCKCKLPSSRQVCGLETEEEAVTINK